MMERMGCGCLIGRDKGRVHSKDCFFTQDSTLMARMYATYYNYTIGKKNYDPWTYEEWQRHFRFVD